MNNDIFIWISGMICLCFNMIFFKKKCRNTSTLQATINDLGHREGNLKHISFIGKCCSELLFSVLRRLDHMEELTPHQ